VTGFAHPQELERLRGLIDRLRRPPRPTAEGAP